ncbi:hypothetical protein BCN_P207 (plasmid) [Bacillus cereus NC7401]|nr:hypothetical protein BCN_P207 [Bacillus cereus NC7401]
MLPCNWGYFFHNGVASGKCGFTTLRKPKYKKSNFSVL